MEQGKLKIEGDTNDFEGDFTIAEIDVENTKEELFNIEIKQIKFNGGSYIAYFDDEISMNMILSEIGKSSLKIKYIRDTEIKSSLFCQLNQPTMFKNKSNFNYKNIR